MCYPVDNGLHSETSSFCFYRTGAAQQGRLMGAALAYVQAPVVVSGCYLTWTASVSYGGDVRGLPDGGQQAHYRYPLLLCPHSIVAK